jgi:hypothetical protein
MIALTQYNKEDPRKVFHWKVFFLLKTEVAPSAIQSLEVIIVFLKADRPNWEYFHSSYLKTCFLSAVHLPLVLCIISFMTGLEGGCLGS